MNDKIITGSMQDVYIDSVCNDRRSYRKGYADAQTDFNSDITALQEEFAGTKAAWIETSEWLNESRLANKSLQEENRRLRDEIAEYKALLMEDEDAE